VIGHGVNRQQLLVVARDDAGDVFVDFFFVFRADQVLPAVHGENRLAVNLRVGVAIEFMPLLRSLICCGTHLL